MHLCIFFSIQNYNEKKNRLFQLDKFTLKVSILFAHGEQSLNQLPVTFEFPSVFRVANNSNLFSVNKHCIAGKINFPRCKKSIFTGSEDKPFFPAIILQGQLKASDVESILSFLAVYISSLRELKKKNFTILNCCNIIDTLPPFIFYDFSLQRIIQEK